MIEMQGPGVFRNPANVNVYQESQTILPQPVVGVGQGVDWDAIGQSAAKLGTTIVEYDLANKTRKKQKLLEDLEAKTRMGIDNASAYNDFDSVNAQIAAYKNEVKNIVGYDIDEDGGGATSSALLEQARKTSYGFELYGQKARRETADDVKSIAYQNNALEFQNQLSESDNPVSFIDERLTALEQLDKNITDQPQQTIGDRQFQAGVRKDILELKEQRNKINETTTKSIAEAEENKNKTELTFIVNSFKSISQEWKNLDDLSKEAERLDTIKDPTEADIQKRNSIRVRLNATANELTKQEEVLNARLAVISKDRFKQEWSEDVAKTIFSADQFSSYLSARETRASALQNVSLQPFAAASQAEKNKRDTVNSRIDSSLEESKVQIASLDAAIKVATNDEDRNRLIEARDIAIDSLENKLLGVLNSGIPLSVKNLHEQVSGLRLMRGLQGITYTGTNYTLPGALTSFNADAVESQTQPHETIYKTFRSTVDKFNTFLSTRMDIPGSSKTGGDSSSESRLKKQQEDIIIIQNLQSRGVVNASPERINSAFITFVNAAGINPYEEDGFTLRPWSVISKEAKDKNLSLPPNGFVHTDWFKNSIVDLLRSKAPLSTWEQTFATAFDSPTNEFFAGAFAATDASPITAATADILVGALHRPETRNQAMAAFLMFSPKTTLQANINQLKSSELAGEVRVQLERLEVLANRYQGNGSPLQYIEGNSSDVDTLIAGSKFIELIKNDKDMVNVLIGTYKPQTTTAISEETQRKTELSNLMGQLRETVFPKVNLRMESDVISGKPAKSYLNDSLVGKIVNPLMRDISIRAVRHYHDIKAEKANATLNEDQVFQLVTNRLNTELRNYTGSASGLSPSGPPEEPKNYNLSPVYTSGAGLKISSNPLDLILNTDSFHNGIDKTSYSQFGSITQTPETDSPHAAALAVSAFNGSSISSIPGNAAQNMQSIALAALQGQPLNNRTMLVAQAAIRDLNNPPSLDVAIASVRESMRNYDAGLKNGSYRFEIERQPSNLNEKTMVDAVVLRRQDKTRAASFQPAPIRKSLKGSDVHRSSYQNISQESFSKWAVDQINSGTVDHTEVVDWLTANKKNNIKLSETLQGIAIPEMWLTIPTSIPNEDYEYELINHLGTPTWFVSKDGGERTPVRSSFELADVNPYRTTEPKPYIYTGAETGLSRRMGVQTVAGKPMIMFEWKGMGTKWMLDSSKYQWETTDTGARLKNIPEDSQLSIDKDGKIKSPILNRGGTTTSDGLIDTRRTVVAINGKPTILKYSKPTLSKKWVLDMELPEVEEKETTTGTIDYKEVQVGSSAKFNYMKPTTSKDWIQISGPSLSDTEESTLIWKIEPDSGTDMNSMEKSRAEAMGYTGARDRGYPQLQLPKANPVVQSLGTTTDPLEAYARLTGEIVRQAGIYAKQLPDDSTRRRVSFAVDAMLTKSRNFFAERDRLQRYKATPKDIRDFLNSVLDESRFLYEQ